MKQEYSIEIRGYEAQQTDFRQLLTARPDLANADVASLIDVSVEASEAGGFGKSCFITIVGYSDRQDAAGLTDAQRRQSERENAQARADSAAAWLLDKVNEVRQAAGEAIEVEWKGYDGAGVKAVGIGASDLLIPDPVSMDDRKQNRRIFFYVSGSGLLAVGARDGISFLFP